jgi:hypothetical protein
MNLKAYTTLKKEFYVQTKLKAQAYFMKFDCAMIASMGSQTPLNTLIRQTITQLGQALTANARGRVYTGHGIYPLGFGKRIDDC